MTPVTFEVLGLPSPQGSKKHVGNGIMVESSKTLATWRDSLTAAARNVAADVGTLDGALHLDVVFRCPMPKPRPAKARRFGWAYKTTAPDLDKLVRAVGDGLEVGGLVASDARIAELSARKHEVVGWTGAVITITSLDPTREETP